jgi:hypothetical protein
MAPEQQQRADIFCVVRADGCAQQQLETAKEERGFLCVPCWDVMSRAVTEGSVSWTVFSWVSWMNEWMNEWMNVQGVGLLGPCTATTVIYCALVELIGLWVTESASELENCWSSVVVSCCCYRLVAEVENPKEEERLPLETVTEQRLVKTWVWTLVCVCVCVTVDYKM